MKLDILMRVGAGLFIFYVTYDATLVAAAATPARLFLAAPALAQKAAGGDSVPLCARHLTRRLPAATSDDTHLVARPASPIMAGQRARMAAGEVT